MVTQEANSENIPCTLLEKCMTDSLLIGSLVICFGEEINKKTLMLQKFDIIKCSTASSWNVWHRTSGASSCSAWLNTNADPKGTVLLPSIKTQLQNQKKPKGCCLSTYCSVCCQQPTRIPIHQYKNIKCLYSHWGYHHLLLPVHVATVLGCIEEPLKNNFLIKPRIL